MNTGGTDSELAELSQFQTQFIMINISTNLLVHYYVVA